MNIRLITASINSTMMRLSSIHVPLAQDCYGSLVQSPLYRYDIFYQLSNDQIAVSVDHSVLQVGDKIKSGQGYLSSLPGARLAVVQWALRLC